MQSLLNAGAYFGIVLLVSIPFFFQYRLFRFFDLSLGVTLLAGAYTFLALIGSRLPEWESAVAAIAVAALVGVAIFLFPFRMLVRRETSALGLTLCALGLYIIGVNGFAMLYGDELIRINGLSLSSSIPVSGGFISLAQALELGLSIVSLMLVWALLAYSKLGRTFRAFGDNPVLAREVGLTSELPVLIVTALGAGLAGLTGALVSADVGIRPTTAFLYIIPGLAAVLMFGGATLGSVVSGAFFVAIVGEGASIGVGQQWRDFAIYLSLAGMLAIQKFLRPGIQ